MTSGRVVHVCKVSGIAGAENHLLRLLPGLAARGHDVHMIVLGSQAGTRSFRTELAAAGIPSERVPVHGPVDPLTILALVRWLRRRRPALVHTHLIHADVHGQAAAALAGVAHRVSTRHNSDPFRRWTAVRWLDDRVLHRVERVIAISHAIARFVVEVEGADPAKVRTVPYGLDPPPAPPVTRAAASAALGLAGDGPLVGLVGRAVRQKGVDVLVDAFPRVVAAHPQARLIIVGDGPLRPALERRARGLGLGRAVTFTGWVDGAARLMPAFDVVAIPSRWEGFGLVALEAMAAARPIVASNVDALAEVVVDGVTGVLVPHDDPGALADAVSRLLDDPADAAALGVNGLRRLRQEYSVARMVEATAALYAELLTGA